MNEVWKAIPGFEGTHEVSDAGRVRSLGRYTAARHPGSRRWRPEHVLKGHVADGYLFVTLGAEGRLERHAVHQLVAAAFCGPKLEADSQVRHLDGDRLHNAATNLRYGTVQENADDRALHGKTYHSEAHYKARLDRVAVAAIRAARGKTTQVDLATQFGVPQSSISAIQLRKVWKHV